MNALDKKKLHNLTFVYAVALSIIALSLLSSSFLMQYTIKNSNGDSRAINLAGRQRMLSQYLTKSVMALERETSYDERIRRSNKIAESFLAWKTVHLGLQHGDAMLELPQRVNSPEVVAHFNEIKPYYANMVTALDSMLAVPSSELDPSVVRAAADVILANEPRFLELMDNITFDLDEESKKRISSMQRLETIFMVVGLLILLFELLFIFRPSLKWLTEMMASLEEERELLKDSRELLSIKNRQLEVQQQELFDNNLQLLNSEEKYRLLIETSAEGILVAQDGFLKFVNDMMLELSGYTKEELLSQPLLEFIYSDDRDLLLNNHLRRLRGELDVPRYQVRLLRKDKKTQWVELSGVKTEWGGRPATINFMTDTTARRQWEEQLLVAKAASEAANKAKSDFLANVSHEIRTPMGGIVGMAKLLEMTPLPEEQQLYVEAIKSCGNSLLLMVNDLLDLSKIEAGKMEIETVNFNLDDEIAALINLLSFTAHEKNLELISHIDPDVSLCLIGDSKRLRQIITNLIGNSIKFTGKGSVSLHISIDAEEGEQTTLRFQVRDSGIGIAADKLEHIFEPFAQADISTTRFYGGTGLGLSITRQLVELMGGHLGVESVEGEGSNFWFTVDMVKQAGEESVASGAPVADDQAQKPLHKSQTDTNARLLLAEDDRFSKIIIQRLLLKSGYQVDVVNNGREAVAALEKQDYDLVLMDCGMPLLNGFEATALIRNQLSAARNHAIPVIALTAGDTQEDRDKCLEAGMDDFLTKPFVIEDMQAMLDKWLPTHN